MKYNIMLSYDYIAKKIEITWYDIKYAIERNLISPVVAIERAIAELSEKDECSQEIIDLACLRPEEPIKQHLDKVINFNISYDDDIVIDKWLYLILDWLFYNKDEFEDPLGLVEQIYADFDYPQQISGFVRYMPSDEPDCGSLELNEKRMYDKWEKYLTKQKKKFCKKR
ncbi:hypothetical protein SH1V18_32590 [Vallitalea longa]|uniref:DUF2247 family protein n=1 Tax=Vallitalea longa TaxID=2936439 RepID=A0A9W5YCY2_9FIRM|nr:DUF2247 family protein [Vallitalea longa]GKX30779.1 hypothetical protein SH1V18_32590 [Vallitalea longa]